MAFRFSSLELSNLQPMRTSVFTLAIMSTALSMAQTIDLDPGYWHSPNIADQQDAALLRANRLLADTMFVEDIDTGALTMVVEEPVLARLEFDPYTEQRIRRIDIRQEARMDTVYVENIQTNAMEMVVQNAILDIPAGRYEEFHWNGAIKWRGTLNGYDRTGQPRKTGEWTEWDANGNVVRRETYP